jgi:hypothetical protein
MFRTLILGLLMLAAARGAAADGTAPAPDTPAAAASAPATTHSVEVKRGAKRQTAGTKAGDGTADPAAAGQAAQPGGDVKMSGMSILGNEDSPKSLVIVPWKSSQMGDMPGVSRLLDPATQPVDKDVFMRELAYYEIKAGAQ